MIETKIKKIEKRDGKVVNFDPQRIINAIYKATESIGEPNYDLSKKLGEKVVRRLEEILKGKEIPKVEQVQDIVEEILVEEGLARLAKAYILYRQKRAEIRKQKKEILEKEEIDEVDKRFDLNALRVLKSRYLRKDVSGKLIESPAQLFERVAIHVMLPSLFYDKRIFQKRKGKIWPQEKFEPDKWEGKIKIGKFFLNRFHLEGLKRVYDRINARGQMKVPFSKFFEMLKEGEFSSYEEEVQSYYDLMTHRKFIPNTPALVNFGNYLGMGSACFVLDIEDSIESIMDTLKKAALIFKAGGGVGYNFSKLRPEGDFVKTTHGVASGPITFMTLFDRMTEVIKQGGVRRGANMGILDIDHPDIEKFIVAKKGNLALHNFNISVWVKRNFWEYYEKKKPYPLVNPRTGKIVKYVDPQTLFDLIVYQAWESAEPGVIFEDHVNDYNPFLKTLGPIRATNPCGELPLYPSESCNLGSINVWSMVKVKPTNGRKKEVVFDWKEFERIIRLSTRFLDNVIDINKYPLKEIEETTMASRKIGLGIMGLGDLLYELEIPYNSSEGLKFMGKIMETLNYYSKLESVKLAKERGSFPMYKKSFYPEGKLPFRGSDDKASWNYDWKEVSQKIKKFGIRNAHTTTNAPTGSISMIAGCSSGIEPVYSLVFEKKVTVGSFYYVDPVFEEVMSREGLFDDSLIKEVSQNRGSIQKLPYIPPRLKKIFVTALDIPAKDHIKALAELQKWTDSSISKTINFPTEATIEEMKEAYLLAHKLGCKDVTVFRYKSIKGVLEPGAGEKEEEKKKEKKESSKDTLISLKDVKAKGPSIYRENGVNESKGFIGQDFAPLSTGENLDICPECGTPLVKKEGCVVCPNCGWSTCTT